MFFYITRFDLGDACGPGKTWLSVVEGDLTTDPRPISGKFVKGKYEQSHEKCLMHTQSGHMVIKNHANSAEKNFSCCLMLKCQQLLAF